MPRELIGRPMEILLVEDSLSDARLTLEALKQGGVKYRVTLVRDGEEAIAFLRREGLFARVPCPDLILLDMNLPKKHGCEVLADIRGHPDWKAIPVVVLTASRHHQEVLESQHLAVEGYMVKPVDQGQFLGVIRLLRRFWMADIVLPPMV